MLLSAVSVLGKQRCTYHSTSWRVCAAHNLLRVHLCTLRGLSDVGGAGPTVAPLPAVVFLPAGDLFQHWHSPCVGQNKPFAAFKQVATG